MAIVPERLWALMTEEERVELKAFTDGVLGPTFRCPSCQSEVRVRVKLTFGAMSMVAAEKTPKLPTDRSDQEIALLVEAKSSGMFDAYEKALRAEKSEQMPKSLDAIESLFLKFFTLGVPLGACSGAKTAYRERYQGNLEFVQSNGVVGVVEDRVLVEFAPLTCFRVAKGAVALRATRVKAEEWIKTRYGYIPKGNHVFAGAMRSKSLGGFGRLVQ